MFISGTYTKWCWPKPRKTNAAYDLIYLNLEYLNVSIKQR